MSDKNLFLIAAQEQYRFPSLQGDLNTEQLFELPLKTTRQNRASLDTVHQALTVLIKEQGTASYVDGETGVSVHLANKQEIVENVIDLRKAQNKAKEDAAAKAALVTKLKQKREAKKDQALDNMSEEELTAMIEQLGG